VQMPTLRQILGELGPGLMMRRFRSVSPGPNYSVWDCELLALATLLEKFDHAQHRDGELSQIGEEREDLMKLVHVNSGERYGCRHFRTALDPPNENARARRATKKPLKGGSVY